MTIPRPMHRKSQPTSRLFNVEDTVGVSPRWVVEDDVEQPCRCPSREAVGNGIGSFQKAVGLEKDC